MVAVHSLSVPTSPESRFTSNRRDFIMQGGAGAAMYHLSAPFPALADEETLRNEISIASQVEAKSIFWDGPSWSSCRYGTSTLLSADKSTKSNYPLAGKPASYPEWMEGYHTAKYNFIGASFPQGRGVLSLRTAGAGLGSCLSLPNVGYTPPSAHATHFIKNSNKQVGDDGVYEDLAYNVPRKFELFWPQSKVLAVQTNGGHVKDDGSGGSFNNGILSPKCLVSGAGCSYDDNPNLHSPASRVAIEFDCITRRGRRATQSCDVIMIDHLIQRSNRNGHYCLVIKRYSQYNIDQDLQTFYREFTSLEKKNNDEGGVVGKTRIAAFLPYYIKGMDVNLNSGADSGIRNVYDENEAVAIYDYKISMKPIDELQAVNL